MMLRFQCHTREKERIQVEDPEENHHNPFRSHLALSHLQELVHVLRHAILIVAHVTRVITAAEASVDWLIHIDNIADLQSPKP